MFDWFKELFLPDVSPDMTQSLIAILLTIGLGVLAGRMKIGKVSLGVSAVMFIGLLFGHYGYTVQEDISIFIRELGLILFVYGIGIQVGPTFFSSFRKEGLKFNMLSGFTVILGGVMAYIIYKWANTSIENAVGLMSGAVTNTPGLGAAKATLFELKDQFPGKTFDDPAVTYAIAYPFGVLGIIGMIIFVKSVFKIDLNSELQHINEEEEKEKILPVRKKCRVLVPAIFGKSIYHTLKDAGLEEVIISRLKHSGAKEVYSPTLDSRLMEKDVLMVVGKPSAVDQFIALVGKESTDVQIEAESDIISKTIFVTRKSATHKKLSELNLYNKFGLKVTRIYRSGMELLASPDLELFYGDRLRVVGNSDDIKEVEKLIGNSEKKLLEPDFLSLFGGLLIGIVIGSIPIFIPTLALPVKLGFAAGPLIAALLISRYGGIGVVHSYINNGAIYFMKDLGICLFFASVGLHAGTHFYENFVNNNGALWLVYGLLITLMPLVIMVIIGRFILKINYYQLAGLMSGTYTDPAALSFCNSYMDSDLPTKSYATVYPLVTILRIFMAKILILLCI